MSKADPDPLPTKSILDGSGLLNSKKKLECHLVLSSLKWNDCEFDLHSLVDQASWIFAKEFFARSKNSFEYSLLLTDDREIEELNNRYRNKSGPTNVLSFPQFEIKANNKVQLTEFFFKTPSKTMLGDIAMSWSTFRKELITSGKKASDHFAHLLIHSLLHLVGYDHIKDEEANKMMEQEIRLLSKLNIENPYNFE